MTHAIKWITIALFSAAIALVSAVVYADKGGNAGGGKGHSHGQSEKAHKNKGGGQSESQTQEAQQRLRESHEGLHVLHLDEEHAPRFSDQDRTAVVRYFHANPFQVTALPPGIAKNIARGKPVPPGIAKRYLPSSIFPTYPDYTYVVAGRDVLLVDPATHLIIDILQNVLR